MGLESFANPYPGLRPFEFAERRLFFGREGQSDELARRLQGSHFLAVVGTSGSGKSSLVRAGLLPMLYGGFINKARPRWRVALLRPGNDPLRNLAAALHRPAVFGPVARPEPAARDLVAEALIETRLSASSRGLREHAEGALAPDENLLVVVDQWEELFRFKKERQRPSVDDEAAAFVRLLIEATPRGPVGRVHVVVTMRSDFLGDCAQFRDLPEKINEGQYLIPRMTREQLRRAIESPALVGGGRATPRLVNRLLNDIGDNQDQLPVLQHALMRTWDEWLRRGDPAAPLDLDHYLAIGGMAEALSRHADEAYAELEEGRPREIAERLFKSLTELDRDNRETRRRTTVGEVCAVAAATPEEVFPVVNTFRREGRTFVMPPPDVPLDKDTLLDISHESLIRNWTQLKEWVKEEADSAQQYRDIVKAAKQYERKESGLWRNPELAFALKWRDKETPTPEWAARYHPSFQQAMVFLDAGKAASTARKERARARRQAELVRERQTSRKFKLIAAAMFLLMLLSAGLAAYAVQKKWEADETAREIEVKRGELFRANELLTAEKSNLIDAKDRMEKITKQLSHSEDNLYAALDRQKEATRRAEEARKRAVESEAAKVKARASEEEARASEEEALVSEEKTRTRDRLNRDALIFFEQGRAPLALGRFVELLDNYESDATLLPDQKREGVWWATHNLGVIYADLGQYTQAATMFQRASATVRDAQGESARVRIATLRRLARLFAATAEYTYQDEQGLSEIKGHAAALAMYPELLKALEADAGFRADNPRYEADVQREFADLLSDDVENASPANLDRAKGLYEKALVVYERDERAQNYSKITATLDRLAKIALRQKNNDEAEKRLLQALAVREREALLPLWHLDIARNYGDLATLYAESSADQKKASDYKILADNVRALSYSLASPKSLDLSKVCNAAFAYCVVGKCERASALYDDVIREIERRRRSGTTEFGKVLVEMWLQAAGFHHSALQDDEKAGKYYSLYVKSGDEESSLRPHLTEDGLEKAALFYQERGQHEQAAGLFRQIYDMELPGGSARPITLKRLALSLAAQNRHAEAQEKYEENIKSLENYYGKFDTRLIAYYAGLGDLYLSQGKDEKAEEYFRLVEQIFGAETGQPDESPHTVSATARSLVALYRIEERKNPNTGGGSNLMPLLRKAHAELTKPSLIELLTSLGLEGVADYHNNLADVLEIIGGDDPALKQQALEARKLAREEAASAKARRNQFRCLFAAGQ